MNRREIVKTTAKIAYVTPAVAASMNFYKVQAGLISIPVIDLGEPEISPCGSCAELDKDGVCQPIDGCVPESVPTD